MSATTPAVIITAFTTYCVSRSRKRKRKSEYPLCVEHKVLLLMSQETLSVTLNMFCIPAPSLIKYTFYFTLRVSLQANRLLFYTWMFPLCGDQTSGYAVNFKGKNLLNKQSSPQQHPVTCLHTALGIRETDVAGSNHVMN